MAYNFGKFALFPDKFELRTGGELVPLEPQVFLLLKLLIENRDRVVTKDELVEAIWGGRVVSDASISSRIKSARIAVGDVGKEKLVIRTIHGQGFRFVAELSDHDDAAVADRPRSNFFWQRHRMAFGVATAVTALALLALLYTPQFSRPRVAPASVASMAYPLPDKPSIAVLPFKSYADDPAHGYFADGMTEDLITDLARLPGLFVIARSSTAVFRDEPASISDVAEALGVQYVLEGSVRRESDQLRVNVQLIDALTGYHIWAERFDRSFADVFQVQNEIVARIKAAMAVELLPQGEGPVGRSATEVPEAYDLYLQGREHYQRFTPASFASAIEYFEQALELDQDYASVHAALANIYWFAYDTKWDVHLKIEYQSLNLAEHHLALAIRQPSAEAYIVSAKILVSRGHRAAALAEIEKAVETEPNNPVAHDVKSWIFFLEGRAEEAEAEARVSLRLNPRDRATHLRNLGRALFAQQRYPEAAETLEMATDLRPEFEFAYHWLAATYGHLGRQDEARAAVEKYNDLVQDTIGAELTITQMQRIYGGDWYDLDRTTFSKFLSGLRKAGVPKGGPAQSDVVNYQDLVKHVDGVYFVEGAVEVDASGAKALFDRGAVFVNSRGPGPFARGHIPGAVHVHFDTMQRSHLADIASQDTEIVFYCGGPDCSLSPNACAKALAWGYQKVFYFSGGYPAWTAAGYLVETE